MYKYYVSGPGILASRVDIQASTQEEADTKFKETFLKLSEDHFKVEETNEWRHLYFLNGKLLLIEECQSL